MEGPEIGGVQGWGNLKLEEPGVGGARRWRSEELEEPQVGGVRSWLLGKCRAAGRSNPNSCRVDIMFVIQSLYSFLKYIFGFVS